MCKCIQKSLWFIIIRVGFGRYEIVVCFTHVGVMPYARYASKTLTVFWTLNESEREIYNFFYYYLLYVFCAIHYVQRTLCNVFATCPSCTTGYSNWNNMWLPKRSSLRSVRRQTSRNVIYSISLCVFAACAASDGSLSTLCSAHGSIEYTYMDNIHWIKCVMK